MNPLLEKAQRAAHNAKRMVGAGNKQAYAAESLAWTALYFAALEENKRQPLPPAREPGRSEAPTKVLPPTLPGGDRRFGSFGGDDIES